VPPTATASTTRTRARTAAAAVQNLNTKKSAVHLCGCNRWPQHCWLCTIVATTYTGDAMLLNARNPSGASYRLELPRCYLWLGICWFAPCQHD
jgi:hypothetical protein